MRPAPVSLNPRCSMTCHATTKKKAAPVMTPEMINGSRLGRRLATVMMEGSMKRPMNNASVMTPVRAPVAISQVM